MRARNLKGEECKQAVGKKRGDDEMSSLESHRRGPCLVCHSFRLDQRSCALFGMDVRGMKAAGHGEGVP